jgi:exonuclease III
LYETWSKASSDITLNGYKSYNFYRKYQHRNARRSSGGIAIYFKEHLNDGISIIRNHYDTIIWLKLDHDFFNIDEDIYLCAAYIWGDDSPMYNTFNIDLFELLENDVTYFSEFGKVYTTGDYNSRVGNKCDYIIHDYINILHDDLDYCPDQVSARASVDNVCNNHGIKLLDLCKSTCTRIVNGRIGDSCKHTFYSQNGTSTIDYVLTSERNFAFIVDFKIGNFNEWSDHAPLHLSLCCNNCSPSQKRFTDVKFKWDSSLRNQFRSEIIAKLPVFNSIVHDIDSSNRLSINNAICKFTDTIRSVADPLFSHKYTFTNKPMYATDSSLNNADWFDSDCESARRLYINALNCFNLNKSDENRANLCHYKKLYKELIRKKKGCAYRLKMSEIENLKKNKPRDFWKFFKSKNKFSSNNITVEDFKSFFENISNNTFNCDNDEAEQFCSNYDFSEDNSVFPELDVPLTVEEVKSAIKQLKRNKSSGVDHILNEYFIECSDIICSHLCDIFNCIFESGYFPEQWTQGIIIPLHKKGSVNDVNNYRGITLVSCFSKLFTTIINKRIECFCENNNTISDAQFGFRKGYSTIDAIYILMSIVQKYVNENNRLYVIYVDMMKCFDSIYRNALWLKLYKNGIRGKILQIIKDMYENVKSCVKSCTSYSDYFRYSVGLRQGEVMSPVLFSLFVEDLELFLQNNIDSGLIIDDILLILLLFADDMAILGKTPEEVQTHLDNLLIYCNAWGLKVNTSKTKIMVFRKRGRLRQNESWTYDGHTIEIVDNFNYLGTVINYTGSFSLNQEHLVGKALKAMNILSTKCKLYDLKPKILCQLFDAFVGSILNYASEIWGFTKSKEIERIHLKFCKRLLQVRPNSCNACVYGELGRFPLYINRYTRMLKYWFKISSGNNIILKTVYNMNVECCLKGHTNWISHIKKLLDDYGFTYVFNNPNSVKVSSFICKFKNRLIDAFKQEWFGTINNSSMLDMYRSFKTVFIYEPYLDILPRNLRKHLVKLRMSVYPLRIQTGRYASNNTPRNERYCLVCNSNDIEDEFHFVCICRCYINIRRKYLKRFFYINPSVFKFHQLLVSTDKNEIVKLCKYIQEAFEIRNTLV